MLSPGILTGHSQPMTTLRIQEEMDKIPYIKYARYFMSHTHTQKRLSFELSVWFFDIMQKVTTKCNVYMMFKNKKRKDCKIKDNIILDYDE